MGISTKTDCTGGGRTDCTAIVYPHAAAAMVTNRLLKSNVSSLVDMAEQAGSGGAELLGYGIHGSISPYRCGEKGGAIGFVAQRSIFNVEGQRKVAAGSAAVNSLLLLYSSFKAVDGAAAGTRQFAVIISTGCSAGVAFQYGRAHHRRLINFCGGEGIETSTTVDGRKTANYVIRVHVIATRLCCDGNLTDAAMDYRRLSGCVTLKAVKFARLTIR